MPKTNSHPSFGVALQAASGRGGGGGLFLLSWGARQLRFTVETTPRVTDIANAKRFREHETGVCETKGPLIQTPNSRTHLQ